MGQGVNFTPDSARRISDAVKKIESLPTPTNTQRRRAGGLGRMTLWEVTAVQTTPKTVTIKRVETQAGALIDASEKEDVLYDLQNEPSTGDQGLLVRLGDGSLFFFRRDPVEIERIYVTEQSWISAVFPDQTFGYPTTSIMIRPHPEQFGFLKFSKVIPAIPSRLYSLLSLGRIAQNDIVINPGSSDYELDIWPVLEDFDPSTVTWNNDPAIGSRFSIDLLDITGTCARTGKGPRGFMFTRPNLPADFFGGSAYGIRVAANATNATVTLRLERTALGNGFQSFVEFVRI